jgi:hypothetical protein
MTETQNLKLFLLWKFEFCACFGLVRDGRFARYSDFGFYSTLRFPKRAG